ncbi:ig-like domain-containing protein [Caerostris extrusa]|uniref:Ig-like domain-containing protein n=1 Tax=Caerostris extrusa TaxID=172846 RepID=A0AAV4MUJ6_CAEEX|nr:ig-like domain-containing protein [Caerostris extrusa]
MVGRGPIYLDLLEEARVDQQLMSHPTSSFSNCHRKSSNSNFMKSMGKAVKIHDSQHFINEPTTARTEAVKGKVPPMQDESLTKELEDDVEPPIQRPSVSEGASSTAALFSHKEWYLQYSSV